MIATFFRWKIKPECEQPFHDAWNAATEYYLTQGSHGSSLWLDGEGNYCAFALWPDAATRAAAFASAHGRDTLVAMAPMVEAVVDKIDLDPLENYWRLPGGPEA